MIPPPGHDTVHVWRVFIPDAPVADLSKVLSEEERARADRYMHARDRNQFIVVRGWLRCLLGHYLRRPPEEISFVYGPQSKPVIAGSDSGIQFNVSHSADLGVLAFCRDREVGVDVELIEQRFDVLDLARSCFSSVEQTSLKNLPSDQKLERFFQFWTAKESYIKALGGGLSIPLQEFSVDLRPESDKWSVRADDGADTVSIVRKLMLRDGYSGAVAATGTNWDIQLLDVADEATGSIIPE
jgi:4'-phosphopantetheinyl transferase